MKHQQHVALLDAVDLALDEWEAVEELAVVVMEMNVMAGRAQEVEARVRVMEYVVEMGVEAMPIVLAPVLFALSLYQLQHCHPHADSLLEEHGAYIQQGLRYV